MPFVFAASLLIALSNARGPSRSPPRICPGEIDAGCLGSLRDLGSWSDKDRNDQLLLRGFNGTG
jgi:hypothetical protein